MNADGRAAGGEELPGSPLAYKLGFGTVRLLAKGLWNVKTTGLEHIPPDGPAILTPNHLAFCDSVFVPAVLPRRMWYVGKGEYMNDWKTRYIFPAFGMIPIDRTGGKQAMAALDTAARVLQGGNLFGIYPEGTRSRDGELHKGRTGAARLSVQCNAPIIPVGIKGTPEIQPPDSVMMRPFKTCEINFGAPMHAADHGPVDDPRLLRTFTDAVMYEISQLSGQNYIDTYASKSDKPPEQARSTGPRDGRPRKAIGPRDDHTPTAPHHRNGNRSNGSGNDPVDIRRRPVMGPS